MDRPHRRHTLATIVVLAFFFFSWRLNSSGIGNIKVVPQKPPGKAPPSTSTTTTTTSIDTTNDAHDTHDNITTLSDPANATKALIIARLSTEDTDWVDDLPTHDPNIAELAIYTVDDPDPSSSNYTVPQNKGHEAMVYLTYIIDHYSTLHEISIFMHSHQKTWHNNDFLDSDSALMIHRLRPERVLRDGYMNLRCHHQPGCPKHIHPTIPTNNTASAEGNQNDILNIPESTIIGTAWLELFPSLSPSSLPDTISQPCCGQFAVSKAQILSTPLAEYISYRNWLSSTDLEDKLSGRVWEYTWHYIFGKGAEFCPDEYECYCEGYGVCFESREQYTRWFEMREEVRGLVKGLKKGEGKEEGKDSGSADDDIDKDRKLEIEARIKSLLEQMNGKKELAVAGGSDGKGW